MASITSEMLGFLLVLLIAILPWTIVLSLCYMSNNPKTLDSSSNDHVSNGTYLTGSERRKYVNAIIAERQLMNQDGYKYLSEGQKDALLQRRKPQAAWGLDSCASEHCVNDIQLLEDVCDNSATILAGLGTSIIKVTGSVTVCVISEHGIESTIQLKDVCYVPSLPINLLSVARLASEGLECDFVRQELRRGSQRLCSIVLKNNIYVLPASGSRAFQPLPDHLILPAVTSTPNNSIPEGADWPDDEDDDVLNDEMLDDYEHKTLVNEVEHERLLASVGFGDPPISDPAQLANHLSGAASQAHDAKVAALTRSISNTIARSSSHPQHSAQLYKELLATRTKTIELVTVVELDYRTFRSRRWNEMVDNIEQAQIETRYMHISHFRYLFPDSNSTSEHLRIHEKVKFYPMIVSHDELAKIIKLTESGPASVNDAGNVQFYVREFPLKTTELIRITELLTDDNGRTFQEALEWLSQVIIHGNKRDHETVFTVRYVGTCTAPLTPWNRHQYDIEKRHSGIFGEFLGALYEEFPAIVQNASVFTIDDATLTPDKAQFQDTVERGLIEWFGHKSMLNRQRGGFYSDYVRLSSDAGMFLGLNTNYWHRFRSLAQPVDPATDQLIEEHFQLVQQYANENPELTGTGYAPFTDAVRDVAARQAKPHSYRGAAILIVLGRDITFEDYLGEVTFFGGKSRAAYITKELLRSLGQLEAQNNSQQWFPNAFQPSIHMSFVDYWPWPRHRKGRMAISFLKDYLSIVRPLIGVSFGKDVAAVTRADFDHDRSHDILGSLTDIVGVAEIRYYNDDKSNTSDCAYINIPHIHPGRDKYGAQDIELRRVLDLTWQLTLFIANEAMSVMDELAAANQTVPPRRQLCELILARVQQHLTTTKPGQDFQRHLDRAKLRLTAVWKKVLARQFTEFGQQKAFDKGEARLILDAQGRRNIADIGFALGEPESAERDADLNRLWHLNLPDLHLIHEHTDESRPRWTRSLRRIPQGLSYFLGVISQLDDNRYLLQILKQCPDVYRFLKGLDIAQLRDTVILKCGFWIKRNVQIDDNRYGVAEFPGPFYPTETIAGTPIGFNSLGGATIRWRKSKYECIAIRITCRHAVPRTRSAIRVLAFTEHGIDIMDGTGKHFRDTPVGTAALPLATLSLDELRGRDADDQLYLLWKTVRLAHGHEIPLLPHEKPGVIQWVVKKEDGVSMLLGNAVTEKPLQNKPPSLADANYLLWKFLEQRFANRAGAFRTFMKPTGPKSTLHEFLDFLDSAEYCGHPWTATWIRHLRKPSPNLGVLSKNIPLYRAVTKIQDVHQIWISVGGNPTLTNVKETWWKIGLPGTFSDPFKDTKSGPSRRRLRETAENATGGAISAPNTLNNPEPEVAARSGAQDNADTASPAAASRTTQNESAEPRGKKRGRDSLTESTAAPAAKKGKIEIKVDRKRQAAASAYEQARVQGKVRPAYVPYAQRVSSEVGIGGRGRGNYSSGGEQGGGNVGGGGRGGYHNDSRECYRCGQVGHIARFCTNPPRQR